MYIEDYVTTIFIIVIILSFLLSILQVIELIRYFNYGKINKEKNAKIIDCKWNHTSKSVNNNTIYNCIKPKILSKNKLCRDICRHFRYKNIPTYNKSFALLVGEYVISLVNLIILIVAFNMNL